MDIKISALLGNEQKLDGGAMFGNAPKALWQRWCTPDELGRISLQCRSLLLQTPQHNYLFEAGIGAFFEPAMAERFGIVDSSRHILRDELSKLGLAPSDIDYVILSHLHFDHAGGLLPTFEEIQKGAEGILFKKAQLVTSQTAFERALKPHPRDRASFPKELVKRIQEHANITLIKEDLNHNLPLKELSFRISNGHTPGQLLSLVEGASQNVFFCGDLIPGQHWVNLPITMGYDRYPELLIDEKTELYNQIDLEKTHLFFTHDYENDMALIHKNEKGRYVAKELFTNTRNKQL